MALTDPKMSLSDLKWSKSEKIGKFVRCRFRPFSKKSTIFNFLFSKNPEFFKKLTFKIILKMT